MTGILRGQISRALSRGNEDFEGVLKLSPPCDGGLFSAYFAEMMVSNSPEHDQPATACLGE